MAEDLAESGKEYRESEADTVARAATAAVSRSRGAAILNTSEIGISQAEIVKSLPDHYHSVSVEEIMKKFLAMLPCLGLTALLEGKIQFGQLGLIPNPGDLILFNTNLKQKLWRSPKFINIKSGSKKN